MAESLTHFQYVNNLYEYVKKLVKLNECSLIDVDLPDRQKKPSLEMSNFSPDLKFCSGSVLIIGEAKTLDDIERRHSLMQYEAYINEAISFKGESTIIFFVPMFGLNLMRNIVRVLKMRLSYSKEITILDDIGRVVKV